MHKWFTAKEKQIKCHVALLINISAKLKCGRKLKLWVSRPFDMAHEIGQIQSDSCFSMGWLTVT